MKAKIEIPGKVKVKVNFTDETIQMDCELKQ